MNTTRALALSLALALLALVLLALSTPAARAADPVIRRVTTTGATTWPCGDQSNWSNPCTLDTALAHAGSGDELWVAAGTYTPTIGVTRTATFQLQPGVALYGGFAMTETLRTQRNFTAHVTILSGDIGTPGDSSDNAYHVVTGNGVTTTAVLDGFTVTGGKANDFSSVPNERGGGMYNLNGSPTVANVTFISNTTSGSGGGMFNDVSSLTLTNVTFSGNSATNTGGGMSNNGGNPTLTNVIFSGNRATSGGGMFDYNSSNPTLTNVTFSDNRAQWYGGGMFNTSSSPTLTNVTFFSNSVFYPGDRDGGGGGMYNELDSSPTLSNVTFSSNSAISFGGGMYPHGGGGGMHNYGGSSPTLSNTTFISNTTAADGGGMYNDTSSNPTLSNVTFSGNSAIFSGGGMYNVWSIPTLTDVTFSGNSSTKRGGGGMYNYDSNPTLANVTFSGNSSTNWAGGGMSNNGGSPTLTNATFINNTAYTGGGMYSYTSSPTLTNVTFFGNSATAYGGGMYTYGSNTITPTIRNTILWSNTAITGAQIYNDTSTPSLSDSVVQGGYVGGTHIITADPLLGALGNWGGSTQTIPLLPGSSAIDAGNDATCAPTDQRGKPRVGTCDIGAFEFQGYTLTKTGGDNQSTLVNTSFASSLQVTLTESDSGLPAAGATITFTAPSSGASAAWSGSLVQTATTNASGMATVGPPTANGIAGSYTVTATVSGPPTTATFALTNLPYYLHLPLVQK